MIRHKLTQSAGIIRRHMTQGHNRTQQYTTIRTEEKNKPCGQWQRSRPYRHVSRERQASEVGIESMCVCVCVCECLCVCAFVYVCVCVSGRKGKEMMGWEVMAKGRPDHKTNTQPIHRMCWVVHEVLPASARHRLYVHPCPDERLRLSQGARMGLMK